MKYCIDSSSLISLGYEWYPRDIFPTLYQVLENLPLSDHIVVIDPIFKEITNYHSNIENLEYENPIHYWLTSELNLETTKIDDLVKEKSLALKIKYKTERLSYKGASQQDILLIAFASINSQTVVSEEAWQEEKPSDKRKWKIPRICKEEKVPCINLQKFIRKLNIRV